MYTPKPIVGSVIWRDPRVDPPPLGVRLFLLTRFGVCIQGNWYEEGQFAAWSPFPDTPEWAKQYMQTLRGV